jgi:hypothetical protein
MTLELSSLRTATDVRKRFFNRNVTSFGHCTIREHAASIRRSTARSVSDGAATTCGLTMVFSPHRVISTGADDVDRA